MGGFFGAASKNDCVTDVFFGIDYHSHLGTKRGGMTAYSEEKGFQRAIHSIENTPFRTKFENDASGMNGRLCMGSISDSDPQPILVRSKFGTYAVCNIGIINNYEELSQELLNNDYANFETMSSGLINSSALVGTLMAQKNTMVEGIKYAQERIDGTLSLAILTKEGIILARDKCGRLPIIVGRRDDGYCFALESFAFQKLGYTTYKELEPGEIVMLTADGCETLEKGNPANMKICSFLWTYYGYPNAVYEGVTVETMRTRNGEIMAEIDKANGTLPDVDYICGVPDSGVPHAIGYANKSGIPFARPFIKYTPTWPRSFMPPDQTRRQLIANKKLIAIPDFIKGKSIVCLDDSIVRGTQLRNQAHHLYENGAKEIHMRIACPPLLFGCKFINFSRSSSELDLIARKTAYEIDGENANIYDFVDPDGEKYKQMVERIRRRLGLTSLAYQRLDDMIEAIGLPKERICTYCWDGQDITCPHDCSKCPCHK